MERRLYRSTTDKYIGGVCGGLGEYFGMDPALIRILFLLLFFAKGTGFLAYVILWIAIRRRPVTDEYVATAPRSATWSRYLPGLLLVLVGLAFLVHENWYWFDLDWYFDRYWPVLLIGLGAALILFGGRNRQHRTDPNVTNDPSSHRNGEAIV